MLAEQEAWKIAESSGLDLVTILPNFVLGPVLSDRAGGTSVGFLKVWNPLHRTQPHAQLLCEGAFGSMTVRSRGTKPAGCVIHESAEASQPMHCYSGLLAGQHKHHVPLRNMAVEASVMQGIAEGTPAQGTPLICDVRDVARAHVVAAETPSASGRYIVSHGAPLTATALAKALQVGVCGPVHPDMRANTRHAWH